MENYKPYINALRQCAKEHENDITPFAHIRVSDLCKDTANLLEELEQEPKRGHWKLVQRGKRIDVCCSNCEATRIKEWAYNYTIDQLDKEDVKECFESDDMRYCPYCGSDNREVEE